MFPPRTIYEKIVGVCNLASRNGGRRVVLGKAVVGWTYRRSAAAVESGADGLEGGLKMALQRGQDAHGMACR